MKDSGRMATRKPSLGNANDKASRYVHECGWHAFIGRRERKKTGERGNQEPPDVSLWAQT